MYKNQLQEFAQRSCINLPSYSCIREGPDHAPRFKARVNFNGEVYESPSFCSTLRQAEHSAAELALKTLSQSGPSRVLATRVLVFSFFSAKFLLYIYMQEHVKTWILKCLYLFLRMKQGFTRTYFKKQLIEPG